MKTKLEKIVPYVDNLKLGDDDQLGDDDWSTPMYSQCIKFSFDVSMLNNKYKFLKDLHSILEMEEYKTVCVKKLKDLNLNDPIVKGDSDEVVLAKVLYEVRYYIHHLQSNPQLTMIDEMNVEDHINILHQVYKEIIELPMMKKVVKAFFQGCISDLKFVADDLPDHLCNGEFYRRFSTEWDRVRGMFTIGAQQGPLPNPWQDGDKNEDQSLNRHEET